MTAIRAAKVMGLSVAGVDILRSNHGPLVMEVNSSPGLEGIETTTGKNVAGMIIEHLEKNGGPNHDPDQGQGLRVPGPAFAAKPLPQAAPVGAASAAKASRSNND
jgi:hypothetical protein